MLSRRSRLPVGVRRAGGVHVADRLSTFVFLLPALHAVTRSVVAVPEKAVVVAFLFVCVLIPVLVPALTVRLVGDRVRALNRVYNLLMGHRSR